MSEQVLHRSRLGEQTLRNDAFNELYDQIIEETVTQMLSLPPGHAKVAELHAEMVITQRIATRFASWVEAGRMEVEKQQATG